MQTFAIVCLLLVSLFIKINDASMSNGYAGLARKNFVDRKLQSLTFDGCEKWSNEEAAADHEAFSKNRADSYEDATKYDTPATEKSNRSVTEQFLRSFLPDIWQ